MAKKKTVDRRGGTLGDFAAGVGTFLGKAERKWREWGPSEAIEKAVTDVRDRAAALLDELNAARTTKSTGDAAEPPKRKTARKTAKKRAAKPAKAAAPKRKTARKARR